MSLERQNSKRPAWVWIISILIMISVGFTLLSLYFVGSGAIPIPAEADSHLSQMTMFDYSLAVFLALAQLYAAIAFLRLKKIAFYVFSSALAMNVLISFWHAIVKGLNVGTAQSGLIGTVIGWAIGLAICAYAWRLMKQGVLT